VVTLVALVLSGLSVPAFAQRNTATVTGMVVDMSGGVLPGADVELTNEGTGIVERQVTSASGEFIFNYVPGGSYTITISIQGFKTSTTKGIEVGAAQNIRRTFQLEVGEMEENITVTGAAPMVNTVSPEQRINLEAREVSTLPTANRNITNLLSIGAGVTKQEGIEGGSAARRIRLNGLGGSSTSITANGTDASGNAGSRQLSQYNSISKIDVVSIEAVGEVQIVKGVVPAEYGQALAGNLNIITKSGTNAFHGSAFHRYEGAAFSARPALLRSKPDSTWNQYGGSLGGPINRDRAFFFAAFEGYRQETSIALNANVPTQRFRDLALASLPGAETRLWLDQFPSPTEPVGANALTGVFVGAGAKENKDEHVDLRADFRVAGGNLSTTFTGGHPYLAQASVLPNEQRVWESLTRRATASYAVAHGRWSSESRFGYSYNWLSRTDPYFHTVDPAFGSSEDRDLHRGVPRLGFPGLTNPEGEQHVRGLAPSYTLEQQVAMMAGAHAIKFGGIYTLFRGGRWNYAAPTLSFDTPDDLLTNRPRIGVQSTSPESRWSTTNFGFFVQDDWRVRSNLSVNFGVRYDYFGRYRITGADPDVPAGITNLDGRPDENFNFGPLRPIDEIYADDAGLNLGPRIGFNYNPDDGKTVVNGGFGMMFQPFDTQNFEPDISNIRIPRDINYTVQEAAALGYRWPVYSNDIAEDLLAQNLPPRVGILIDPQLQAPYAMVYTLGVQRALTSSLAVEIGYVGTRGYKFKLQRQYNEPDRITGIRPNPSLSDGTYYDNSQRTTYHGLLTSLRQRMWHHVSFNLNYTLSSNMAHAGGDGTPGFIGDYVNSVQDFFNSDAEWGPASGDSRHSFVGSAIYEVPEDQFSSTLARHLLGGWQLSGIFRASSGVPLRITQASARTASRPDVVDAESAVNAECCGPDGNLQYLNREAFATVPLNALTRQTIRAGNVGNGQFRGPGSRNIDLSLAKSVRTGGPTRLELRVDMLNALNWVNYTNIQTNINASNFGRVTGTADARIVQIQARLSF
jgi:outer membrane receptor protein involved in Fe transport